MMSHEVVVLQMELMMKQLIARFTVSNIFWKMVTSYSYISISRSLVWWILTEYLEMCEVCEWCVLWNVTLRIWSCTWEQVSNSSPVTLLKMKIFFDESLRVTRAGSITGLPIWKKPPRCGNLQKNQHRWSSKNVHPLERSFLLFFGISMVSCYSNFIYKKIT